MITWYWVHCQQQGDSDRLGISDTNVIIRWELHQAGGKHFIKYSLGPLSWFTVKSLIQETPNPKLKCFLFHLAVVFAQSIEARGWVENYVVGTALTGDALTTSEWATILLPIKVRLISDILRCHENLGTCQTFSISPNRNSIVGWNPSSFGQFTTPKTCEKWLDLINSYIYYAHHYIYYAHQTREIYEVLPYSVDFKAPGKLWYPLSKTALSKCSFIWNKGNIWNYTSRQKRRHLKSVTISSASRSHSGCVLHQGMLSTPVPFVPWQSGLPFPRYNLILKIQGQRSRSKVPQSVQHPVDSCPLCFTSGHPIDPVPFVPWQSGIPFTRYNLTFKIQGQRYPSQHPVDSFSLVFHIKAILLTPVPFVPW